MSTLPSGSTTTHDRPLTPVAERTAGRAPGQRVAGAVKLLAASLLFMAPLLVLPYAHAARLQAWQPAGLRGEAVLALGIGSSDGERIIYAETRTGLWCSTSNGNVQLSGRGSSHTWQRIDGPLPRASLGGPALAAWRAVPGRGRQLYVVTGSGTARQLFRSENGGATWQIIGPAPGQTARPPMVVQAGLGSAADTITLVTDSRVQRSTDGGATWAPGGPWPTDPASPQKPVVQALLSDNSAPERLYALASSPAVGNARDDGALWLSDSGGLAWRVAHPGADLAEGNARRPMAVTALAIVQYFGIRIWAATTDALAYSTDGGHTWISRSLPPAQFGWENRRVTALLVDPRAPDTVYAALAGGAIYRSDDSGISWTSLGKVGGGHVNALALDPDTRGLLYVAMADGVWVRRVVPPLPPTPSEVESRVASEAGETTPTFTPEPTATSTATQSPLPTTTASPQPTPTSTVIPSTTPSATPSPTPARSTATATPTGTPGQPPTATRAPEAPPSAEVPPPPPPPTTAPLPSPTPAPTEPPPTAVPTPQTPLPTPEPR